ncbi:MAG: DUF2461 domain-containing protein [Chloroflexi bacterium]|nr:MAG: DUF2461 domain-containing protein [Chloroflexota bacterium]TMD55028.1 MAG: DUF2461 domain-containing protein [Chloroflexota bacterium]
MVKFEGWSEDFQRFFIGLELDNSKRYFDANKKLYLERVRGPLEALLAELEPEFGKGKIARANRDIRFSANKAPYKTNVYAMTPGGYVALDAKGLTAAGGRYEMEKSQLDAYRAVVAADRPGAELERIVSALESAGYEIGGEELKRIPPGFPPDHPRARLLRHKRLYFWKNFGLQPWLGSARAREKVAEVWRAAKPLEDWFAAHVPAGSGSERRR